MLTIKHTESDVETDRVLTVCLLPTLMARLTATDRPLWELIIYLST